MTESDRRVLMLLEDCPYCYDGRVPNEAQSLVRAGYHVSVISVMPRHGKMLDLIDGVHLYQYPAPPNGQSLLNYLWEYSYSLTISFVLSIVVLVREGFDVVHAHNPPDMLVLIAAFYKLLGKRFVYDHHDLSPEMYEARGGESRFLRRILLWFEQLSCHLADRIIATNGSYRAIEMGRGQVPAEKITIVRNGPDLRRMRRVNPDPDLRRRAATILGYVGVMGPQDGLDGLLRALHHLVYDLNRRDVLCVLIGGGDMLPELQVLAQELRLRDHVWFTGWLSGEELVPLLSTADICVVPDRSNPYSDQSTLVKTMEYMALGKPIVAFDLTENRITAQEAAVYARANDELDFAKQIALLMDTPEQREKMGRLGQERVETELAWPHQEKRLLDAYEKLFQHRP